MDKYRQKLFRQDAQKRINRTLDGLNSRGTNNFLRIQKDAFYKTMNLMRQMGIYDFKRHLLKGTQEEADAIFDIYYNAYLDRAKGTNPWMA